MDAYYICDGGYHYWQELIAPFKSQIPGSKMEMWSSNMESARKDVECAFGILKRRFLFLKNPIELHSPERIEDAFLTCAVLHNWLHDYDGWDDWEGRAGIVSEDDILVEYDPCDESNRVYSKSSNYHGFEGNFTRAQMRRIDRRAYRFDDYEELLSERTLYEERRLLLIEHYNLMICNRTLQCNVR